MTSDKTAREKREVTYEGTLTIRLSTDVSTETFQSREDDNIQNTERKKNNNQEFYACQNFLSQFLKESIHQKKKKLREFITSNPAYKKSYRIEWK